MHRDNFVLGVTTAATLWFSTVMGLCYGAGEFRLGTVLLGVGAVVLWGLRWAEKRWWHRVEATVSVLLESGSWTEEDVRKTLQDAGYEVTLLEVEWMGMKRRFRFDVHRHVAGGEPGPPVELVRLAEQGGAKVTWARNP